jgi:hypothetical protein
MSEPPFALLALALAVVLLLGLVQWVLLHLRRFDVALFNELGSPDLFLNNNLTNVFAFWRWVYGRSLDYSCGGALRGALWVIRIGAIAYGFALITFVVFEVAGKG